MYIKSPTVSQTGVDPNKCLKQSFDCIFQKKLIWLQNTLFLFEENKLPCDKPIITLCNSTYATLWRKYKVGAQ